MIVAVVSTWAYRAFTNVTSCGVRRTYLHEMATEPDMCEHGTFEVHMLADFAVT